ncbi:MAG: hypothetical protein ABW078_15730 [Sedimenticola sp.]
MDMRERISSIIKSSGITIDELAIKTGIGYSKWTNPLNGKQRFNEDHITALTTLFPEYAYWLTTGKTIPESGQISPEIEELRRSGQRKGEHKDCR